MDHSVSILAPAKVNLSLEVLGRRPDGYHDISTVLQTVDLSDKLTVELADDMSFECSPPDLAGADNLAVRAAHELKHHFPKAPGARMRLVKHIPVAAGLGGGSSDAAAALRALRHLWNLKCSNEDLSAIAAKLGSDVPFFLYSGTAWATGRGERLSLVPTPSLWLLLLPHDRTLPDKTRQLYSALRATDFGTGNATRALVDALRDGRPIQSDLLVNSFTRAAFELFPGLRERAERVKEILGLTPHLSGSGPTLFLTFKAEGEARRALEKLLEGGLAGKVARAIDEEQYHSYQHEKC